MSGWSRSTKLKNNNIEYEKDEINVPMALGVFRDGNNIALVFPVFNSRWMLSHHSVNLSIEPLCSDSFNLR